MRFLRKRLFSLFRRKSNRQSNVSPFHIPFMTSKPDSSLEMATYDNATPFMPNITCGKVVRVYDGDTITVCSRVRIDGHTSESIYRFNVRLRGIDTPELKTRNSTEKTLAIKARDALSGEILGKIVSLKDVEYDKYGRILANVIQLDGTDMSKWMMDNKYAVEYTGGTKSIPPEWTDIVL